MRFETDARPYYNKLARKVLYVNFEFARIFVFFSLMGSIIFYAPSNKRKIRFAASLKLKYNIFDVFPFFEAYFVFGRRIPII